MISCACLVFTFAVWFYSSSKYIYIRYSFDGTELLIAMKCYFDGSGDGKDANGDEWITLGGVAAVDRAWADFDLRWTRMFKERYPIAPYIHMIELTDHNDPFTRVNGWTGSGSV